MSVPITAILPRTILFLAANPTGTHQLRLDEEVREIAEGLQRAGGRGRFKLEQKWGVRPRDLRRAMSEYRPYIVHFSGHGAGTQGIVLEGDDGAAKPVSAEALQSLFALFPCVRCVLLNACHSDVQAEAIAKHVPYVIGMSQTVGDKAAITFATAFYDALGADESIDRAFKLGCVAIQLEGIPEHSIPVLKGPCDVFFSYDDRDKVAIGQIADALRGRGLRCWLDDEQRPDAAGGVQAWMQQALERSTTVAVLVGPGGMGNYQQLKVDAAINQQVKGGCRVIPILLPGMQESDLPQFLRRYPSVAFKVGLEDQAALAKLSFMIAGGPATPPAPIPPQATRDAADDAETARQDLVRILETGAITFFLGARSTPGEPHMPPLAWEITRQLLLDLQLIKWDSDTLLPPLDTVGTYYSIKAGTVGLEDKIRSCIRSSSKAIPLIDDRLAHLLSVQARRAREVGARPSGAKPLASSQPRADPQLVVTTRMDTSLERALLLEELPFSRIVQHRDGTRSETIYRQVTRRPDEKLQVVYGTGEARLVDPSSTDELEDCIAAPAQPYTRTRSQQTSSGDNLAPLILYKYHGSQDVDNSCTISTDHLFDAARNIKVPAALASIISNTPSLFLGCGLLDSDFRHMYHTVLRRAFAARPDIEDRYMLLLAPELEAEGRYRRMETNLWKRIKRTATQQLKILILEERGDVFLEKLIHRVAPKEAGSQ